jgi:hypothetical protein
MGVGRYNVPLAAIPHIAITCFTELGTTPVTTPGVPLDGVIRTHTDPLRHGRFWFGFWQSVRLVIKCLETAVEKRK